MSNETITFINPTEHTIKLRGLGLEDVPPGKTVEIPLKMAAPTIKDSGDRGKSQVEKFAPQLRPKDDAEYKAWLQVPTPLPPKSLKVTLAPRPGDEPAGVIALRKAKQEIADSKKPVTPAPAAK